MKINIYYGGRGMLDDPTLYVINKIQEVLNELNVTVERYNLYELKNTITTLPQTLKDVDGVIFATTVEWFGIGGYMQQFLDSCWLYGDKNAISKIYMCPIVMSTTYGEGEAKLYLSNAWEILGGLSCDGISGYIEDTSIFDLNDEYFGIIEKTTENIYRNIRQKIAKFPVSNQAVKQKISVSQNIDLTPQETEQLSQYASDDEYVQKQKEDLQELANMFRGMMEEEGESVSDKIMEEFQKNFRPQAGFVATYKFGIEHKKKSYILQVNNAELVCSYATMDKIDVDIQTKESILLDIIEGRMTFQRAFMCGDMKVKGDFKTLRTLDLIFPFI
ncbi:MAG: SCP2 sterol-binding domain-containing protein [Lachnospiraceae bacterium]